MKKNIKIASVVADTAKQLGISPAIPSMIALMGGNPVNLMVAQSNKLQTAKAETENPLVDGYPNGYTSIEKILHDMMIENTGVNMLDSGGAYGRSWQRNRTVTDFRKRHPFTVNVDDFKHDECYLDFSGDMFTLLSNVLDRDEETVHFEKMFYKWYKNAGRNDWIPDFPANEYGLPDYVMAHSFNTYNDGDAFLSGTFQGYVFTFREDQDEWFYADPAIVAILIHGGCDVRGGYTQPKFFKVIGEEVHALFDYYRIYARCECTTGDADNGGYYWMWDKDYNWKQPEQQTLEGEPLDLWSNIGNEEYPPFWVKEEKPDDGEDYGVYAGDCLLRCKVCGGVVGFSASLGEY